MHMSFAALRKLNLHVPLGEICPLTFQWTFFREILACVKIFLCFFSDSLNLLVYNRNADAMLRGIECLVLSVNEAFVKN